MKFAHLASICAAFGALVSTAHAADMPARVAKAPAAVAAPVFSWTGPYAGLHCGAAWGRTSSSSNNGGFDQDATINIHDTSWTCGGQAGYNWQAGTWVYGVEGDLGYLDVDKTTVNINDTIFATVKYDWYGTLTGRIGPAWDRSFFYLKGGAAVARIHNSGGDGTPSAPDTTDIHSSEKTKWGWALGVGFEQALQSNWTWKIEYLYLDFGKITVNHLDGAVLDTFEHRNRVHTVKLGLNYLFATGKYPVAPAVVTKY